VNLTNDGWFGQSAEQWQHEVSGIAQAVENGMPLVRCCNNGITCWIDATGREQEIFHDAGGSVYGPGAMIFDLPLHPRPPTFYTRHGDWFGWSCVGITLLLVLSKFRRFAPQP
jgi:apolipoprotein N-acyltransferase